jgi:hypothetical protein
LPVSAKRVRVSEDKSIVLATMMMMMMMPGGGVPRYAKEEEYSYREYTRA